jgi:GDSL-like Lipase/Acylhydrolase family
MSHIVILGDSVFDNAAYVRGGVDVITHLRSRLPRGWHATLAAVDGSVVGDVEGQLKNLPRDATHLVVSVGGNDALMNAGILEEGARSAADVLLRLAEVGEAFESGYRRMLDALRSKGRPSGVCTIYYPRMEDARVQRLACAALATFNDVITRAAFDAGLPLIDLRLVCDEETDYANPIEPSDTGGAKIAGVILRLVTEHDFRNRRTQVFV